jgi:hypothetical protein
MSDEPRRAKRSEPSHEYPYIHPERLPDPEHLAIDAEDVEEFIDHFDPPHPPKHEPGTTP